ncbi:Nuclear pore complex, Nup98 component (sc Nup145/Nup100/Nup116) [Plasmopara halstedii]|uniref:Nuclear pore complex, Nup98 component (Sc Nup145/Nup100/Nup116) n=1 Tax=Plasmopara halstedii TaxID=4781 RepID=A0A0P1AN87_PLAHL|nr:Nuclear pore complex, Nup98 component (sc Nup145/Nup100/Nup116) [Plasmopara halstedii]CEG42652.1 Nuclear pore complex, Nup98 component (sc Nup145/Nup100/Nup116) [Plasmopara halstedii]|eukprot:XP_024579021.1 Nuclear pore complex, Nup98 component (sc Nup145/Nup100/Nup116) [Plasmopara halstedii]
MGRPGGYMKPCKFFLRGSCRNGLNCRFSHESNGQRSNGASGGFGSQTSPFGNNGVTSVSKTQETRRAIAIEELKLPSIWPLSGFAVAEGLPSIVTGDISPEEARWEAYQEIKSSGSCIQSTQKLQALAAEQQNQRRRVVSLLENHQSAQKLFAGQSLLEVSNSNGQIGVSNPFGGAVAANPFGTTSTTSPFGSTATANPFGGGNVSFMKSFGADDTTKTATSSLGGGSGIGSATTANPFAGGAATVFGKPVTPATSPFGAPSTASFSGVATSSTTFGSKTTTPSSFGSGTSFSTAFGSRTESGERNLSASPFGSTAVTSASSPFGTSVSSPFSSTSATTFGRSSAEFGTASTPFGASALFGTTKSQFGALAAPSNSPFGTQTTSTSTFNESGGFQKSATEEPTSIRTTVPSRPEITGLSPDLRDDAWNVEQFRQAEFKLGMVPTVPPPLQFC